MKIFTIPNFITIGNLLCGCLGIIFVFQSEFETAAYLIFLALLLDFADGFVARLLNMGSDIGKQLDSLADVISFGLLPALIVYKFIENSGIEPEYLKYIALILAGASAFRLAKFNIDTRQSDSFIGLPTPANGMVIATFPFLAKEPGIISDWIQNPWVLIAYVFVFSFLLNAELPLFALKFKNFSWATNKVKFIFLIISVCFLLAFQLSAIPLIILFYILLSLAIHKNFIKI